MILTDDARLKKRLHRNVSVTKGVFSTWFWRVGVVDEEGEAVSGVRQKWAVKFTEHELVEAVK